MKALKLNPKPHKDKLYLIKVAGQIANMLKTSAEGCSISTRVPNGAVGTTTSGWSAIIGHLNTNIRMEVWYDLFPGYQERIFYAGFYSHNSQKIHELVERLPTHLRPEYKITLKDTKETDYIHVAKRLCAAEFASPVLEGYGGDVGSYFGIYNPTKKKINKGFAEFCGRAVDFLLEVANEISTKRGQTKSAINEKAYPRCENRKLVKAHLARERSRFLANQCKIRDDYRCKVCGLRFSEMYGKLGNEFAEAHHILALAKSPDKAVTTVTDLRTVCSNCHRMLHRMTGTRSDLLKLKNIIQRQRSK